MNNLNKENFWDQLHYKYPKATERFCKWIDEYKVRVNWNSLFNGGIPIEDNRYPASDFTPASKTVAPKFHDIPIEMQMGILTGFVSEQIPEYNISTELENVKDSTESIFKTLEDKILKP